MPAGIYEVFPPKVEGYKLNLRAQQVDSEKVLLTANGHAEANLRLKIFNSISGKLLDEKGRPMEPVCLDLKHAVGKKPDFFIDIVDILVLER